MIVVDVGCYAHNNRDTDSITALCQKFRPELLYGFDPLAADTLHMFEQTGTLVATRQLAAWTRDGEVRFTSAGMQSSVERPPASPSTEAHGTPEMVPCFDLASWLRTLPGDVILKIDAEGAEIPLLRRLVAKGVDSRLALVLVEEHPHLSSRPLPKLDCPVREWWM